MQKVASAIGGFHGEIHRAERLKARRRPPASLQAYELYLLGYELEARFDKENTLECINVVERALQIDSEFSRAWTVLAWACEHAVTAGWAEDAPSTAARRRTAIVRAAELDPNDGIALEELGALRAQEGDISGAKEAFERALDVAKIDELMVQLLAIDAIAGAPRTAAVAISSAVPSASTSQNLSETTSDSGGATDSTTKTSAGTVTISGASGSRRNEFVPINHRW